MTVPEHAPDVGDPMFAQAVKVLAAAVTAVALVVVGDPGPGAVVVAAELNGAGVPATVFTVATPLIVVVVTVYGVTVPLVVIVVSVVGVVVVVVVAEFETVLSVCC